MSHAFLILSESGIDVFHNRSLFSDAFTTMDSNLSITLIIILSVICLSFLARDWYRREKQIDSLKCRVQKLEEASRLMMPQRAREELLDAIAMQDTDIEKLEIELEYKRNVKAHMINAMTVGTKREKGKQS